MTDDELINAALTDSFQADLNQEADIVRADRQGQTKTPDRKGGSFIGTVLRVHDGDTVIVRGPRPWPEWWVVVAVRLLGIDTPELHDQRPDMRTKADQAKEKLTTMVHEGMQLSIVSVKPDKYGNRLLGCPMVGPLDVCNAMLSSGLARPYEGKGPKPW